MPFRRSVPLLLVLLLAACSPASVSEVSDPAPATGTVELDIFSGRPNPAWELGPGEREELDALVARLSPSSDRAPELGLGYRGFTFDLSGPVRAFGGYVSEPGAILADPERSVERYLLDRLPAELADLRPAIQAELR